METEIVDRVVCGLENPEIAMNQINNTCLK